MADHLAAYIEIGGTLNAQTRAGLVDAVVADGAKAHYGDSPLSHDDAVELIDEVISKGTTLRLEDEVATWGWFAEVQHFCKLAKLIYYRSSEAKYEFNGDAEYFDGVTSREAEVNQDGEITVTLKKLKGALEESTLDALIAELDAVNGEIPPLTLVAAPSTAVASA